MNKACLVCLWMLVSWSCVAAENGNSLTAQFEQGNRLYEAGKYAESAAVYEEILQQSAGTPALLFNLGNAQFKSGQLGLAIRSYLRAQELAPRDPDIQANLRFAREQVQGNRWVSPRWQRWLRELTLDEWTLLSGGGLWLLAGFLTVIQLRPDLYRALRWWTAVSGLFVVATGTCLILAAVADPLQSGAVIVAREAAVRSGPFEESQSAFFLRNGAEVHMVDEKDSWVRVEAGGGRGGWVSGKDLVKLRGNGEGTP